jgi:hypothetical protein
MMSSTKQLKVMFDGCVMMNDTAIEDATIITMLRDQQAKDWPSSSGFGNHYSITDLINDNTNNT